MAIAVVVGTPRTFISLPIPATHIRSHTSKIYLCQQRRSVTLCTIIDIDSDITHLLIELSLLVGSDGMIELRSILDEVGIACRTCTGSIAVSLFAIPRLTNGGVESYILRSCYEGRTV